MHIATPASHRNDPQTSFEAERHITASGVRAHQMHRAVAAVRAHPGHTSYELHTLTEICRWELARRLPEAETAGLVRKGPKKVCTVTGNKAVTWHPVERGDQFELPVAA